MTHQVLIASYERDFIWLRHCLRSLKRFSVGFLPPVISTSTADRDGARRILDEVFPEATVVVRDFEQGNLRAQMSMMEGDIHCPKADFTFLVGSDCVFWAEFRPDQYFLDGKPLMLYTSYSAVGSVPWRGGTEDALRFPVQHEFMRRLPLVYPRELFPLCRRHIEAVHHRPFQDYVRTRIGSGGFSESNIMGAFAFKYLPHLYTWMLTDHGYPPQPHPLCQMWSHGGLDRPMECCVVTDHGNTVGKTPRQVITECLGSC